MAEQPIYMLNVLWFQPEGGRDRYRDYLRAAGPIVAKYGGKKLDSFYPDRGIIGELDADLLFFVEWPSWEIFESFINDPEYQAIRPLREEAITNSLLIRCHK